MFFLIVVSVHIIHWTLCLKSGFSSAYSFCPIQTTGGGQKLRTDSLVLPVADNIFK